jgi:hypothetical protein
MELFLLDLMQTLAILSFFTSTVFIFTYVGVALSDCLKARYALRKGRVIHLDAGIEMDAWANWFDEAPDHIPFRVIKAEWKKYVGAMSDDGEFGFSYLVTPDTDRKIKLMLGPDYKTICKIYWAKYE